MVRNKILVFLVLFAVMAVPAMASSAPVSQWQLNNNLNDEWSGNTLTNSGAVFTTDYPSYNFSGDGATHSADFTNDRMYNDDISLRSISGSISLGTWVKAGTQSAHWATVLARGQTWGTSGFIDVQFMQTYNQVMRMDVYDLSPNNCAGTSLLNDSQWHHVFAVINDAEKEMNFYVDGVLEGNCSYTGTLSTASQGIDIGDRNSDRYFTGKLDNPTVYNYALTTAEVQNVYNCNNATTCEIPSTEFNITAFDAETATQINTFNVTLNSTFFSTTNGTITHNVTGEYSTLVEAEGYIPVTTTYTYSAGQTVQWNLTKVNRNITLYAGNNYGDALETFNVSIDGGAPLAASGYSITTEVDRTVLHNLTFTAAGHKPFTFTGFNATSNTTYNATLTSNFVYVDFDATDENSTALTNFNLTVNGVTYAVATNKTFFLDSSELYNVTFAKANYFSDVHTNYNITSNLTGNLTEYFRIVVGTETFVPGTSANNSFTYLNFSSNLDDVKSNFDWTSNGATIGAEYPTFNTSGTGAPSSLEFDGINDNAWGNLSFMRNEVNDQFSYNYWVKTNQSTNFLIQAWRGAHHNNMVQRNAGTVTFSYFDRDTGTGIVKFSLQANLSAAELVDNNWHMVTVAIDDQAGNVSFYFDAELVHTFTGLSFDVADLANITGTNINWGHRHWVGDRYYQGYVDEYQAWNITLTQEQINQLYNQNYLTGSGGSTEFSNTTNQYTVNWNSTTYYPNAENITYLPVRYTLENFTVDPFTAEFKQISKTNYNTTFHLTTTFNNSHQVTATNLYDGTSIANFTVETPTQNYTADGTIAYLQNDTGNITYTVSHPSYFDAVNAGVDVTNGSSSVTMYQAVLIFNGTQRFTNATVADGNVTLPDGYGGIITKAFGEPFYLNAGTYTATYSSVNDEADDQNFTVAVLDNTTATIINITNANLTIIGTNAVDGTPIPFFTSSVSNDTLYISMNQTKTSPHLYKLIQNVTYNVVFDNSTFALGDVNLTLLNRSTLYNFTVYTTNSFNISILNELTKEDITDTNFTVEFIGDYASYNYTYTDGDLYADLIVPDQYQIRYQWINSSGATDYGQLRQYHYLLTNRTHNPLDLFAINKSESTEIEITVQNGNTLLREEGVIVKLQRFYIDTNSYETVAMYETDSQGKAYFDVEADEELYKFVVDSPLGSSVYTSTPQYLKETEYTIFIDTTQDPIATYTNQAGLSVTVTYNASGATATYNDPQVSAGEYEFRIYEKGPYANTLVSTATATTSSGSLVNSYAFDNTSAYYGVFYRDEVAEATFDFVDFLETNGLPALGLFLTSILFVVAVFISAFSLYSVIIASMALVAANMIGLITISTPIIGAVVVGAIILAIILEWRRG